MVVLAKIEFAESMPTNSSKQKLCAADASRESQSPAIAIISSRAYHRIRIIQ